MRRSAPFRFGSGAASSPLSKTTLPQRDCCKVLLSKTCMHTIGERERVVRTALKLALLVRRATAHASGLRFHTLPVMIQPARELPSIQRHSLRSSMPDRGCTYFQSSWFQGASCKPARMARVDTVIVCSLPLAKMTCIHVYTSKG